MRRLPRVEGALLVGALTLGCGEDRGAGGAEDGAEGGAGNGRATGGTGAGGTSGVGGSGGSGNPLPDPPGRDYEIPGTLYYVDAATGSDENPGTSAEPFLTLPYALTQVTGGDGILLRDGDYGDLIFGAEPGAPLAQVFDDWVTIRPDAGHTPVLGRVELGIWNRNGYELPFTEVGNSDLWLRLDGLTIENQLEINGSRHVEVRGSTIRTAVELDELTASGGCVQVMNGQHVTLLDNEITHCGVGVAAMTTDFLMLGNEIHHISHDGLKIYGGTRWLVEGNSLHDIDDGLDDDDPDPDGRNNHADGIHMHTIIHQGGYDSVRWAGGADDLVLRGNLIYHVEAMAVMINQNDWDGTWGAMTWENNLFGPANGRLFIQGSSFEAFIFRHNTVLFAPGDVWTSIYGREMRAAGLADPDSQYYHVQVWGNPAAHEYYNNILASASADLTQDAGVVTHNLFFGPEDTESLPYEPVAGNLQDFLEGGGVLGIPVAAGPAVDAGTTAHDTPATDLYGTPRDAAPDLGAVELP